MRESAKKILLVGASGRLGTALTVKLKRMEYELISISSKPLKTQTINQSNIQINWEDFKLPSLNDIDVVIHLAHQTSSYLAIKQVEKDIITNLVSTVRLVENLHESGNKPHFIYTGSLTEYGSINLNPKLSSNLETNPETFYETSKIAVEGYLEQFAREGYFSSLSILRIGNLYGFTEDFKRPHRGFLDTAIWRAFNGIDIECYGNGNYIRDFIHLDDVCEVIIQLIESANIKDTEVYNLGTGIGTTIKEALEIVNREVEQIAKSRVKIIFRDFPENAYRIEQRNHIADISKIRNIIDWNPKITLQDGVSSSFRKLLHPNLPEF